MVLKHLITFNIHCLKNKQLCLLLNSSGKYQSDMLMTKTSLTHFMNSACMSTPRPPHPESAPESVVYVLKAYANGCFKILGSERHFSP